MKLRQGMVDFHGRGVQGVRRVHHNCMPYAHKDWRAEWHLRCGKAQETVAITGNLRVSGGSVLVGAAVAGPRPRARAGVPGVRGAGPGRAGAREPGACSSMKFEHRMFEFHG
jgi:hypothetical protein